MTDGSDEEMRDHDTPRDDEGVLSTEDLAGARQDTGETRDEALDRADAPPQFPGEATGLDQEDREGQEGREDSGGTSAGDRRETEPTEENEPLLGEEEEEFRTRWQKIQSDFVDDPQDAVNAADQLVAETMQALATTFSEHKRGLEEQWQQGGEVATEDLRVALQHYRSFFNRLLST
ncbi:hypothetical protein [Streptomyces syringium]|uniref:hypothetical protein n=1 Tax=Streptomyces syringium TaxID=76729 RepID=UPI003AB03EB6